MIELPQEIVDHLQAEYVQETRPCCLLLDGSQRLKATWGDTSWCGLDELTIGQNVLDAAPFLIGTLETTPQRLAFITTSADVTLHVVTIPQEQGHYVVLLDARAEHDALQVSQQAANELRLLHAGQNRLIARQRELIAELVETKAELDHRRRDLERSSAGKSRFIAMMSHEFRTPLASIVNYSDLALEQDATLEVVRKSVEAIARSSRHLSTLVDTILDEARLDAGQVIIRPRSFNVHEMLDDLAAMMAPLAAEKGLSYATHVESDVPQQLLADDVCLRQILINLLGNAVKFTVDGGIRLYITHTNGRLVASVSDSGPGISAEDQERVFRAFERGAETESGRKGAGLGLTITLQLAQLMDGEVTLDSTPGNGCTVSVHVPAPAAADSRNRDDALPTPAEATYAAAGTSILVCDDDEDMMALLEHYLHRAGYALIAADNGNDAVEKALRYQPDLVILDVNVPGLSGIEASNQLRDAGFDNPIVALTASTLSDDDRAAFTQCFRKPTPMQDLLAEIKAIAS